MNRLLLITGLVLLARLVNAQCPVKSFFFRETLKIEQAQVGQLEAFVTLANQYDSCYTDKDSVYARIVHRIGALKFHEGDLAAAVQHTRTAAAINLDKNGSKSFAIRSFYNLSIFSQQQKFFLEAIEGFDKVLELNQQYLRDDEIMALVRYNKSRIYIENGSFETAIEEADLGIVLLKRMYDPEFWLVAELTMSKSQGLMETSKITEAEAVLAPVFAAVQNNPAITDSIIAGNVYKLQGKLEALKGKEGNADAYFRKAISLRGQDKLFLIDDFTDYANFLSHNPAKYKDAESNFNNALSVEASPKEKTLVYTNLSGFNVDRRHTFDAIKDANKGLNIFSSRLTEVLGRDDFFKTIRSLKGVNLHQLFALLANKAEAYVQLFEDKKKSADIITAIQLFKMADFAIEEMRSQESETGKLFWTKKTRKFYGLALNAAHLANDSESLFYFMEKSRAILLNDKLGELGSMAFLPKELYYQEQDFRLTISTLDNKLGNLNPQDTAYARLANLLTHKKAELTRFIQSLEKGYPAYYQYKYNTITPSVKQVQESILYAGQSYLSLFETDSTVYTLLITPTSAKFNQVLFPGYADSLKVFDALSKNRQLQNTSFKRFSRLSNLLYTKLIAPLEIPEGRVIVSSDMNLIPFEALSKTDGGRDFLLYDYMFSYTYSAAYLIKQKQLQAKPSKYSFLGIAPETFSTQLALSKLSGSVASIESIAKGYTDKKLIKNKEASRNYFLNHANAYGLLHLYVHAQADGETEPVLFMSDSAVAMSELNAWKQPQVDLAFLAACETGSGELHIGEGINSISRSFAAIGVPATIATLWKADNQAMYRISELFYTHLNAGLPKDVALQKAKIDYLKAESVEETLPYYWSAIVLSGNTDRVNSGKGLQGIYWILGTLALGVIAYVIFKKEL